MSERTIIVHAEWDEEAGVWVATSDDVPGLITEAETVERLERKLQNMIPELLELNDHLCGQAANVPMNLIATKRERLALEA
jgi:predicted RNase H-like HicB family nuclease